MTDDPEVTAMSQIASALASLEPAARARVADWAARRYSLNEPPATRRETGEPRGASSQRNYGAFVDLFHAADPRTESERALVAAYWFQNAQGQSPLRAQQLNDALKDLGHPLGNVTDALTALQTRRPALVRQVSKSGRTRQARKTYRLTQEGSAAVERLIDRERSEDGATPRNGEIGEVDDGES